MKKIKDISIKNKIISIILLVTIMTISLGFTVILIRNIKNHKQDMVNTTVVTAKLIGEYCVTPLTFDDKNGAFDILNKLQSIPSIESAILYDNLGEKYATYHKSNDVSCNVSPKEESYQLFEAKFLYVFEPIEYDQIIYGSICLQASTISLDTQISNSLIIMGLLITILLIIAYILASKLQQIISVPVLHLAKITEDISKKANYSVHIKKQGNDEIGKLYESFNNMLSQIDKRQTEIETARINLKESEQKYSTLVENSTDGIMIIQNEKIVFSNKKFSEITEQSHKQTLEKNYIDFIPKKYHKQVQERYNKRIKGEKVIEQYEIEIINKKGEIIPVEINSKRIEYKNQPANMTILRDITERKAAEESLKMERDRAQNYLDIAGVFIMALDKELNITHINKKGCELLSKDEKEIIGKNWITDLLPSKIKVETKKSFEKILDGKLLPYKYFESYILTKHNKRLLIAWHNVPLKDKNGKIMGILSSGEDITERKRIEKLQIARDTAKASDNAKSEFLANMSHEMRTPLNAILGFAELLTPLLTDETKKDYLESIKSSGKSLLTLINDILDLSKIEAGKLELEYELSDPNSLFNEMKNIFGHSAQEKGLDFIIDISPDTPKGIYIDEIRVRQILLNLLGNAIKFTEKGYIKLSVYPEILEAKYKGTLNTKGQIQLVIEVEDSGIGISKDFQKKLFESFRQQEGQSTKKYGGTGLGLAITKSLVELMDGTITVDSTVGEGSKFKIRLKYVEISADYKKKKNTPFINLQNIHFIKSTILITDDIENNRNFLSGVFKSTNIKTITAENGEIALKLARENIPDLILTDIKMPVMDGLKLIKEIRKDKNLKHIPVIANSASVMKKERDEIKHYDFNGFLMKPIQLHELYHELMKYLPYKSIKESTPDIISNEDISVVQIEGLPELIRILSTKLYKTWETFKHQQPMNEVEIFGSELTALGEKYRIKTLTDYGNNLIKAVENFNIDKMLTLIKSYPTIVDKLKYIFKEHKK